MTIKRLWRGWTTPENADRYEDVLLHTVIPMIEAKGMPGYRGIDVFREDGPEETEFLTIITFTSLEEVSAFMGEDAAAAHVPEVAQAVLSRWDSRARHYVYRAARPTPGA